MKRALAIVLAVISAFAAAVFTGCSDNGKYDLFIADSELQAQADSVLEGINDRRVLTYLDFREELRRFKTTTNRDAIRRKLEDLKENNKGLPAELSIDDGVNNVNEQLFEYFVVRAFYSKRKLDEVLKSSSDRIVSIITESGYKLIYEWKNTDEQIACKYYFGSDSVHDDLNYYSLNTLKDGSIEYMSAPVFYEPLTEQFVSSYAAKSAEERAVEFEKSVKYFASKANVADNKVLGQLYSEAELEALQGFLDSLDIAFLDEHNISTEEEPYSNRQIPVELGNTRFILRITLYGVFMDVIQNKDYYKGGFYSDLDILRRAFVGAQPTEIRDDIYFVIG